MSKEKGNRGEREICRILSKWWTGKEKKDVFWRRDVGGFFATKRQGGTKPPSGDIVAIDPIGDPFCDAISVEVKRYAKEDSLLFECLAERKSQILKWWKQCENDALDVAKVPWLIVKFNNRVPFIILPKEFYKDIEMKFGKLHSNVLLVVHFGFEESVFKTIIFMQLDNFLNWCKPEVIPCK